MLKEAGKVRTDTRMLGLLALDIYCAYTILSSTAYTEMLGSRVFGMLWKIMIGLLVLRVILDDEHTVRQLFTWALVFPVVLAVVRNVGANRLFLQMSLALLLYGIPFRRIVRHVLGSCLFWTLFTALSCAAGILRDLEFNHGTAQMPVIAHGLGFNYYSNFAFLIMTITFAWLYLRGRKCTIAELVFLAAFHYICYRYIHTTRLVVLTTGAYLILFLLCVKLEVLTFRHRIWKWLAMLLPFVMFGGTWAAVWGYDRMRHLFALADKSFPSLTSRLNQSAQAYHEYGVRLLGNKLYLQGNQYVNFSEMKSGLYLDSNYVYLLLVYGIVFSILILVLLSALYGHIYEAHDPCLFIWFGSILMISMVNNFLLNGLYNVGLLLLAEMLACPEGKEDRNEQQHSDQPDRIACGD